MQTIIKKSSIFISHKRSRVWTKYFTRLCIIISSTCVIFFNEFRRFFRRSLHVFSRKFGFQPICSLYIMTIRVAVRVRPLFQTGRARYRRVSLSVRTTEPNLGACGSGTCHASGGRRRQWIRSSMRKIRA